MNLELYKIFYEVAKVGNITKASNILNISQPAVTKHIKNLEYQLNTILFIRTKKGVVLTECGKKLFIRIKQALDLINEAENEVLGYSTLNKGTIKIGISTTLMKQYLIKYIEKFHEKYPNIIFDIYTDPTKELIVKLKNGLIDIVISKFNNIKDNELNYTEIGKLNYIFVANRKYFNLDNEKISLKDLKDYPILLQKEPSNSRNSANGYFNNNNIKIEPAMNIASSNLILEFTKMGYGIGYITDLYVKKELEDKTIYKINVNENTPSVSFGIITLKNNSPSNITVKFLEYIRKN